MINQHAVYILPPPLIHFYKKNILYISEKSVIPDKLRYVNPNEAPRHYIDIDHYFKGRNPFQHIPIKWNDAVEKFSKDTLLTYGVLPWHIQIIYYNLVKAFKEKNLSEILKYSAYLGHYVADAHVPLHTTENYDGQLTGQKGIHALWESSLPEEYAHSYQFWTGKAILIQNPLEKAWNIIQESHAMVDSVLMMEKYCTKIIGNHQKYGFQQKSNTTKKTYSKIFLSCYHNALNRMVERRMKQAILSVSSYWYTAWVDAGMPNLEVNKDLNPNLDLYKDSSYQKNYIPRREHEH
jgi:hypothetical protein